MYGPSSFAARRHTYCIDLFLMAELLSSLKLYLNCVLIIKGMKTGKDRLNLLITKQVLGQGFLLIIFLVL